MNKTLKNVLTYAGIVLLFVVLAYSFVPEILTGKVMVQGDITGFRSMAQESAEWDHEHPEDIARWTGSMFSGMPNVTFRVSQEGDWTQPLYTLLFKGKKPANWLIVSLIGAFLLMLSLGAGKILAVGGAIAMTFCSYNLQIIQVGHNTKMQAIALLPWVLAAVIFTYKKALGKEGEWKSWLPPVVLGSVLFGLALSMQVKANHQQITYYLALMIAVYVIALFIDILVSKEFRRKAGRFFAASALLLIVGLIGIGTNVNKLAPLYEYTQYTMRGGSELSHPTGGIVNNEGLQLDYATAWSYGWEELPNLMIPNFNGGASTGGISPDKSEVVKLFKSVGQGNPKEIAATEPMYWGPQPFTAGPMYMGAITIFLFLLGLFLYKGKEKWWILIATILAVFLAVGNHFIWFTKLFYDYAPMYNKFRTVSMSLVILQYTLPMLGFLVLDRIMRKEYTRKEFLNAGFAALALTAGFCLICVLFPGIVGSFSSPADSSIEEVFIDALRADRQYLMVTDAFWSMILIVLSFCLILWAYSVPSKAPETYASDPHIGNARRIEAMVLISALVFVNLFVVGKRYLDPESFTTPRQFNGQFKKRPVDEIILSDEALSYRMADITKDIFNDAFNSYWHKNIGGYSPAKLQRYQDLIDRYISKEFQHILTELSVYKTLGEMNAAFPEEKTLSMLNMKYLVVDGEYPPLVNPYVYGNAWFVDGFVDAPTPDDEINLIDSTDLRTTAIIGADFKGSIPSSAIQNGTKTHDTDSIRMTYYSPNELHYHYTASTDRPVVFSEIYYPKGWHATVDPLKSSETELELFRTDWILRGAVLPAGEHDIVMRFDLPVYTISENVSRASSITLLLLLVAAVAGMFKWRKKETE